MTLNQYVALLNELVKQGHGDKTVIASSDDEGNAYHDVAYAPSVVNFSDVKDVYRGKEKMRRLICIN